MAEFMRIFREETPFLTHFFIVTVLASPLLDQLFLPILYGYDSVLCGIMGVDWPQNFHDMQTLLKDGICVNLRS